MSQLGKIPVSLAKDVKVTINQGVVNIDGPKGKTFVNLPRGIKVEQKDSQLIVSRTADDKQSRSNHGTTRAHIVNMLTGVTSGHKKELEIQGVGFRVQEMKGQNLILNLGFSHPVEYIIPKDVKVSTPKPTQIIIEGMDRALVGHVAANIRDLKPPEPYKGKGVRYLGEAVKRKQGKSVTK